MTARAKQVGITAIFVLVLVVATAWAATQARTADAEPTHDAHDHTAHDHGGHDDEAAPADVRPVADRGGALVLDVRDGEVIGGPKTFDVEVGDEVALRVTGDDADEVHVHGYDLSEPLGLHEPVELRFDADIPGVFDIELEERHVRLALLRVS